MTLRNYSSVASKAKLTSSIDAVVTTIQVDALTGYPASTPFTIVVDPDQGNEELMTVTSVLGTTLSVLRGVDGSAASTHAVNAVVQHCVSARDFAEPNGFLNGTVPAEGTIQVNGMVNVSQNSISSSALEVSNTGFGPVARINGQNAAGSDVLYVSSNGFGNSEFIVRYDGLLEQRSGASAPGGIAVSRFATSGGPQIKFRRIYQASLDTPGAVAPAMTSTLGNLGFEGWDGTTYVESASIDTQTSEAWTSSAHGTEMRFWATDIGTNLQTERMRFADKGQITGTGISLGAWTSYTPTLSGTGWALGNGTSFARYCQIGKTVHFRAEFTFGSTSTFGAAGNPICTLPVAAKNSAAIENWRAMYVDTSAGAFYDGVLRWPSSTTVSAWSPGTNGLFNAVSSTVPFAWASGDGLRFFGTYEAA